MHRAAVCHIQQLSALFRGQVPFQLHLHADDIHLACSQSVASSPSKRSVLQKKARESEKEATSLAMHLAMQSAHRPPTCLGSALSAVLGIDTVVLQVETNAVQRNLLAVGIEPGPRTPP